MTVSTLRPNATTSNNGALMGGATAHAVLSDDSDASYVTYDTIEFSQVGLTDLTLPAAAVIKSVAVRLRTARVGTPNPAAAAVMGIGEPGTALFVSWTVPTTTTLWTVAKAGFTDSQIDGETVAISNAGTGVLRVYEAYVDVAYVTQPVVLVNLPTGTVTDTNLPTVTWTPTLDADGGVQTRYWVKVFTDAQYLAGGFDPNTSTPTLNTLSVASAATSWQATSILPNDTYRAYVTVAQTVNGVLHWAPWGFSEFTVNVALPGTPTINATADSANARNTIVITDVPSVTTTTDRIELERSVDGGTTWEPLRTLDGGFIDVPYVVATGTFSDTADGTTHNAVLPAPAGGILANDLLIAFVAMDGNPTIGWPSDWTELKDEAGNGSAVRVACAYKWAVGDESGTIAVTTSASEGGGIRILCIRAADGVTAPAVSTGVNSAAANANPDALNPAGWDTENTLWIAVMGNDGDVAVTAGPANYSNFGNTRWANVSGAGVATATRLLSAVSEDPGAFTNAAEDSRAYTAAVRPRNATLTVFDYEAPNGVLTLYRARSLHNYSGVFAASAWAQDSDTWTSTGWWLKHPNQPALNMAVTIRSYQTRTRAGRQGIFQSLGASVPIVVSDTRETARGALTLRVDSISDQDAIDDLLDTVDTLLVQAPAAASPPNYIRILSHERQKVVDWQDATRVFDALEYVVVDPPAGDVVAWP